jgi:DNA topoisomerase IA
LASISTDAVLEGTKVIIQLGKFELSLKGIIMKQPGFLQVADWMKSEDKVLDNFNKGAPVSLSGVVLEESSSQVTP